MEILIYGEIGTDILSKEINEKIRDADEDLVVRINSYGGDVFHAVAIHNALKNRGGVEVRIDGVCASAATIIAMGGERILMPSNARFMIHEPATLLAGYLNLERLERITKSLRSIQGAIRETYRIRTKMEDESLDKLMKEETWMNAEEAKAMGFIDEIIEPVKDMQESIVAKAIESERARVKALESYETKSIAAKAVIKVAKENGKTIEEIQPYLNAIESEKPQMSEFEAQVLDNLTSGAENVGASPSVNNDGFAGVLSALKKQMGGY